MEAREFAQPAVQLLTGLLTSLIIDTAYFEAFIRTHGVVAQGAGQFEHAPPGQRQPGNGFLHPILSALHALGEVDFSLPFEQADRSHLPQIDANGVIGGDGLPGRLLVFVMFLEFSLQQLGRIPCFDPDRRGRIQCIFFKLLHLDC